MARTDLLGTAIFNDLYILDVKGYQCFRFVFLIGQHGHSAKSVVSDQVCYVNKDIIEFDSADYSRTILQSDPFEAPVTIRVILIQNFSKICRSQEKTGMQIYQFL